MDLGNKTVNKYAKCFFIQILIVLVMSVSGCSALHGRFIELNFEQEDNNQPVRLSDHEVFFAGGWDGNNHAKINSAKIYNVRENKLIPLGVTMNYPRINYGAIKYDDNHILIVGGRCADTKFDKANDCSKIAEVYDIKENKFTRISNTNLSYRYRINTILLKDGRVFIYSDGMFEMYNPNNNRFEMLTHKKNTRKVNPRDIYTINDIYSGRIFLLNDKEILILGYARSGGSTLMEIFNLDKNQSTNINIDNNFSVSSAVQVEDGSILFIGHGKDSKNVAIFNPKEKTICSLSQLPKAMSGHSLLLSNNNILLVRGGLSFSGYMKPKILERGVYDYKNNKVYKRKIRYSSSFVPYLIPLNEHTVYISGYKDDTPMLYKY